jgi:hypothetical protein
MLAFLLFISVLNFVVSLEPSCTSCKFFIPNNRGQNDLGLCRMFKNNCYHRGKEYSLPNYAIHCRVNENLCGKTGFLYESMKTNIDNDNTEEQQINIELNELNQRCCGEVNEKDEIEQLEKDFFEVFQKIRKHNKKQIYKTTKDLYKLFKRD